MFAITKEDIQKLSDKDLRELVGKLCEAELRKQNIPLVYVTYGGNQDATDGGIDVCVNIEDDYHTAGFVPRKYTGFQVKVPQMPPAEVKKEMRPDNYLRDYIKEIADHSGSYIIISAQDDTSKTKLAYRKDAMKEAVSDYPAAKNIKLDFYDSQRIATWVNGHASLILWVHMKTGTSLFGWQPFTNWSNVKGKIDDEYFTDGVKIVNVGCKGLDELTAVEGITQIRQSLNTPGVSVRIVGLSGVGKTRLAEALCDNRIGKYAINPDNIVYTDFVVSPNPSPEVMIEILQARNDKTILIIDNCAPELHRILSDICKKGNGNLNLLTIEYDIQTDQKEEVDVYKIEPSSVGLIEKILKKRYSNLGSISNRRIAEFSGGNARIALALADELRTGDDISTFSDDQLFRRLFWQGRSIDNELFDVAKACSIVYSFSIETNDRELDIIAQLINLPSFMLYKHAQELQRRGLMQCRNKWRAVLPHPLANWLANRAFEEIPADHLRTVIEGCGEARLLRSFSKRMGFLHKNDTVKKLTAYWLSKEGILKDIANLNDLGISVFENIAPVDIEKTLLSFERVELGDNAQKFFSKNNPHYQKVMDILYAIAYDPEYFERCAKLLIRFALTEERNQLHTLIRDKVKGLFQMYLSGTLAPAELRLLEIDRLIKKGGNDAEFGFDLLDSALGWEGYLCAHFPIDFGSRNRNAGYFPKNMEEVRAWYNCFISYMQGLLLKDDGAEEAKQLIAKNLCGMLLAGIIDEINSFANKALEYGEWGQGWMSIKDILYKDRKKIPKNLLPKIQELLKKLEPKTALENARASLLSVSSHSFFYRKENDEAIRLKQIGYDIVDDENALNQLIPDILCSSYLGIWPFAVALGEKSNNPEHIWSMFIKHYSYKEKCNCHPYQLLGGFLKGLNGKNAELVEKLLEEAVKNELSYIFPLIQTSIPITKQGTERLIRSIKSGKAPLRHYVSIGHGRVHETINDHDLCEIIRLLVNNVEGLNTGIEIYSMRIYEKTIETVSNEILELGFELLSKYDYKERPNDYLSYEISQIVELCFTSSDRKSITAMKNLCENIKSKIIGNEFGEYFPTDILTTIAKVQPELFLDAFLDFTDKVPGNMEHVLIRNYNKPILDEIKDDILFRWCEKRPETRYMIIASVAHPFSKVGDKFVWQPIGLFIIKNVSEPCKAVDLLLSNFLFNASWSKFSDYYLRKIEVLEALIEDVDDKTQEHIKQRIIENQKKYNDELESEKPGNGYGFE